MSRLQGLSERVKAYLAEMGLDARETAGHLFVIKYGSTVVMISLFHDGAETYCRFASLLLKDFEPSLELLQRVLRLNTEVLFGSFLLFEDNTLSFSATVLGDDLDYAEFEKTLQYVAKVSDEYDDELLVLGGGYRAEDILHPGDATAEAGRSRTTLR